MVSGRYKIQIVGDEEAVAEVLEDLIFESHDVNYHLAEFNEVVP